MTAQRHIAATAVLFTAFAFITASMAYASAISFGVRPHVSHPPSTGLPYSEGNMSYLLAYEHDDGKTLWQMGVSYTAQGSSTSLVTSVVTPQLHLILKDKTFWGGIGVMKSYVEADNNHWTDFYWQMQVGIHLPLTHNLELKMGVYYLFDEWGHIGDFSSDEVELGMSVAYSF